MVRLARLSPCAKSTRGLYFHPATPTTDDVSGHNTLVSGEWVGDPP